MKVEIAKLDGSFGPVAIEMTAETNEDRATLSLMGKISLATKFQIKRLSGNEETLVERLMLQEYEEDPKE